MPCAHDKTMYAHIQQSANIVLPTSKSACVFVSNEAAVERIPPIATKTELKETFEGKKTRHYFK